MKERSGAPGGIEDMRRAIAQVRKQNVLTFLDLGTMALAEAEARAGDLGRAGALLDEALATDERAGCRAFEAELHRARGEILVQRGHANPAPAEDAFLAAIAVAKQQGTRSFELRAALSLAKLYAATGGPDRAHAVLFPALEGFSPTPGFRDIDEALEIVAAVGPKDVTGANFRAPLLTTGPGTSSGDSANVAAIDNFSREERRAVLDRTVRPKIIGRSTRQVPSANLRPLDLARRNMNPQSRRYARMLTERRSGSQQIPIY